MSDRIFGLVSSAFGLGKPLRTAVLLLSISALAVAADLGELKDRRLHADAAFNDGILIVHAKPAFDGSADGFRQDGAFYYFTGLENAAGAILAVDGRSSESWLFLADRPVSPEVSPGSDAIQRSGIEHVVDWSAMGSFLTKNGASVTPLYYLAPEDAAPDLPVDITASSSPSAPLWAVMISQKWPSLQLKEAAARVHALMDVQSPTEMVSVRAAATATIQAVSAGMRAVRSGVSQRSVEAVVADACWKAGAHGV